ncbi:low specificity L-threonine aldolase [Mesorhizobium sp. RP14(2022)]|uniref:L-threonine aldolase n=1 Tax=Mesorhizobium liriopis TaxID=2953882 RepID=A0ABT1C1Y5_9HYPH|nr:low specificity L-threonine aldolase [Mesorhizobium liriopis]MCO6048820.1 low specificity L-threonine aldolase [Mesorhizobium liriopis]
MFFASDNWAGAHPLIAQSLVSYAGGYASAYGTSDLDRRVEETFNRVFEREVAVFFVATGTAANSLALAATSRPGGICFAHAEAHMLEDECGAPEFLSSGGRLRPVQGSHGKIDAQELSREMARFPAGNVHSGQPMAVSVTQSTETGSIYSLSEIEAIAQIARSRAVPLHMDGARFANALVALDCSPAEMTWKRGVDLLSFGGTKNGCWCAEALVFFDPEKAREFGFMRKRAAQLFSKTRFVAAQFESYFADDLWLENAKTANRMAKHLATALHGSNSARLAWKPQANEVFAVMSTAKAQALQAAGARFYDWKEPDQWDGSLSAGEGLFRFVTSYATQEDDVTRFAEALQRA